MSEPKPNTMDDWTTWAIELFRLASLIGCEPEDEERHRKQLMDYIQAKLQEVDRAARMEGAVQALENMGAE